MEIKEFIQLIRRKKQTIATIMITVLVLSALFTFLQPLKYSSTSKIMVVQSFSAGSDPYVTAKSNEYLSNVLSEVISSNSFFVEVMKAGFDIDTDYFSGNAREQMKEWLSSVDASANAATGMIDIVVYHKNKWQAEKISQAINYTLQTKHSSYHGSGNDVEVKIIDQPLLSSWPVKPNIVMNFSLAFVFGFVISIAYIYILPSRDYDIRLFPGSKRITENSYVAAHLDVSESISHQSIEEKRKPSIEDVLVDEEPVTHKNNRFANSNYKNTNKHNNQNNKNIRNNRINNSNNNIQKNPRDKKNIKGNMSNVFRNSNYDG
ncbi:hypothetical protein C0583_02645 [Candidatus Parcubacteria bacterium]|nr:MAG: hypothetical protein C0583_02645 [Candidatus Parcubacteria bacterium]